MGSPRKDTINALSKNSVFRLLYELMATVSSNVIAVPASYVEQVEGVKDLLQNDRTGIVNTMLDFSINASIVNYEIETGNSSLNKILNNDWLKNINKSLRGKIPVGINGLSKEYGRERWKGSSLCLLRSLWTEEKIGKETYILPTKLWFVQGEDIIVDNGDNNQKIIGAQNYSIQTGEDRTNTDHRKKLPMKFNNGFVEEIFIQKPYNCWSDDYPVPYVILKGLYWNMEMLKIIEDKSGKMVSKAIEYLAMLRKGSEKGFIDGKVSYNEKELTDIKDKFQSMVNDNDATTGLPLSVSQWDTEFEHIIPEYERILKHSLRITYERNLLAGLGLIEVIEGIGSARKESILSPKPFVSEIESGVSDFTTLIIDLVETIKEKNKNKHKKFMNIEVEVNASPIKQFISQDILDHMRSAYDRGDLSRQTYTELCTCANYKVEKKRRDRELLDGDEDRMYPHIVQNIEKDAEAQSYKDGVPEDKQGIEKKNYRAMLISLGIKEEELESAPYTKNTDLPKGIRENLLAKAQTIYRKSFNAALEQYKSEEKAFKVAWNSVKQAYKKVDGEWIKK